MTSRRAWCLWVLIALGSTAIFLVGCGDGGRHGSRRDGDERIRFIGGSDRSAFGEGALGFVIEPALADGEQLECTVDHVVIGSCVTAPGLGEIKYTNLVPGLHRLDVVLREGGRNTLAGATHFFEIVEPAVVVFGANPAGITAAIAAARAGQRVALLEPTEWVGGMMSSGLAKTDIGARGREIIGGMTAEFFSRVREIELAKGVCFDNCQAGFDFEPHVAEQVFEEMIDEAGVVLERSLELIDVVRDGANIKGLVTSRGFLEGDVFIDASYEGDLMALAGISWRIGRDARIATEPPSDPEALAQYEEYAGMRRYRAPLGMAVDPYVVPGLPSSGTLSFVEPRPSEILPAGTADSRVMAYTYRLCVTDDPDNRIPFSAPVGYDAKDYEAHARVAEALSQQGDLASIMFNPARTVLSRNRAYYKYDLNGGSTFSTDMTAPELNQSYIQSNEAERQVIRAAYRRYIEGLFYTWQSNPRFGSLNAEVSQFGYCADEFVDRGGWPHKLYVRIGRRMIGEYVMNENDVLQNGRRPVITDVVGFGAYDIDMHTHRYFAAPVDWPGAERRDAIVIDGFLIERLPNDAPYPISWRALVPLAGDAANLINPVTLSATQVAYSSLRMEPTLMILGESAGVAAALAVETRQSVQSLDYPTLRARLVAVGQLLKN